MSRRELVCSWLEIPWGWFETFTFTCGEGVHPEAADKSGGGRGSAAGGHCEGKMRVEGHGKRGPLIRRRVDVPALETARLEKELSVIRLCAQARVDPSAYRNLIRHQGERSRDAVLTRVLKVLGLKIGNVVTFPPGKEDEA